MSPCGQVWSVIGWVFQRVRHHRCSHATEAEKGAGPLQTDPQVHSHLSGTEKDLGSNADEVAKEAGLL